MRTPEGEGATILVADSEDRVLKQVSATLEKAGFTVVTTLGRTATLEFCNDHSKPVELVILDSEMGASAPDLIRSLYESHGCSRVLMTGDLEESAAPTPLTASGRCCAYLKKPFRRSQLLGTVLKVMEIPLTRTA